MNVRQQTAMTVTKSSGITLAENQNRTRLIIGNRESSAVLYVKIGGTTVGSTNYTVKIAAGDNYEIPDYSGKVLITYSGIDVNNVSTEFYEFT